MDELDNLLGSLTGAAVAGFAQWVRYDNRTQDRLANTTNLARDLRDTFLDQQSWGDAVRSRVPVVQDWQSGIAIASQTQSTPSAIPSVPSATPRPNLCQGAESAVSAFQYPPRPGVYDERWNVKQLGELSTTALAMTLEEVRATIHAFILCGGSTGAQRVQIYRAVNTLIETVAAQGMTRAQFADVWGKLFAVPGQTLDPHIDPTKPPTIASINTANNVQSVTFITTGTNNENNPQTDNAHRLRVLASSSAAILPNADICTVNFATLYRYRRADGSIATLQPNVIIQAKGPYQFAVWISSVGYTVQCINSIGASSAVDITVTVEPGVITV